MNMAKLFCIFIILISITLGSCSHVEVHPQNPIVIVLKVPKDSQEEYQVEVTQNGTNIVVLQEKAPLPTNKPPHSSPRQPHPLRCHPSR